MELTKMKYAYVWGKDVELRNNRKSFSPIREEEIEILRLTKDTLIGNLTHLDNSNISRIDIEDIREDECVEKIKFFSRKKVLVANSGWVRLKKFTRVELDLRNRIVTKIFEIKE